MESITVQSVTAPFIGKALRPTDLGRRSGNAHLINISDFQFYPARMEQYAVTPRLREQWERLGTEIHLSLTLEGDLITAIGVSKLRESGACARPCTRDLKCTPQELRILRRVLQSIT